MARFVTGKYVHPLQLRVGSGGRNLCKSGGSVFPLFVDSGWEHARLQSAGWQSYLDAVSAKGYTAVFNQGPLSYAFRTADAAGNPWFNAQSMGVWDMTQPNTANFANQRAAIDYAATKGLVSLYWPAYTGFQGTLEGIINGVRAMSDAQCETYGAYIGTLMNTAPNVVYVLGGDHYLTGLNKLTSSDLEKYRRMVVGIKSTDRAGRIFTWHAARGESSYELDNITSGYIASLRVPFFDFAYCREKATFATAHDQVLTSYEAARMVAMLEGLYVGDAAIASDPTLLRRQTWGTWLSGGCGHAYGDGSRFEFNSGWEATLASAAQDHDAIAIDFLAQRIEKLPLIPSTGTGLVTSGGGTRNTATYNCRAMSRDRKLGLVHVVNWPVTIDRSQMAGAYTARLFDPTNNTYVTSGTGLGAGISNTGTQQYTDPGNNSAGNTDRVLVLEAA